MGSGEDMFRDPEVLELMAVVGNRARNAGLQQAAFDSYVGVVYADEKRSLEWEECFRTSE